MPTAEKSPGPSPSDGPDLGPGKIIERSDEEAAVIAASNGGTLTTEQVQSATEWFMSDEVEQPSILVFDVDVASAGRPSKYIRWQLRSLQRHEIKQIREDAIDPNTGREDDMEVNMRILIKASVDPNFAETKVRGQYADPADLVNARFAHKPGIIEAIARKANEMSGYGNASIIRPVDAAGN